MTDAERLTELEIRYTLQEETLQHLSDMVVRQAAAIAALEREVDRLRKLQSDDAPPFAPDERPPHY